MFVHALRAAWPASAPPGLHASFAQQLEAITSGAVVADDLLAGLAKQAREQELPELVCDFTALRAIGQFAREARNSATELARTASRMARTESLSRSECLASVVLARARRIDGEIHRATRILSALLDYAPAPFRPWIEWELALADPRTMPTTESASRVRSVLHRAVAGERASFIDELAALRRHLGSSFMAAQDVAALELAVDVECTHSLAPAEVRAWRRAEIDPLPWGLAGLSTSPQPVYVVARPDAAGVRILDLGMALVGASQRLEPARAPRPDTVLALLGMAGPGGLGEEDLFAKAYGFPFQRGLHQGVLDVLMHRARARLGALGQIERTAVGYVLRPAGAIVLPDPRSGPKDDDRVLQLVASKGTLTAREASSSLGVSLRTAQVALDSLAESGACVQVRRAKHFEYRIEDTTFQEPTGLRRFT